MAIFPRKNLRGLALEESKRFKYNDHLEKALRNLLGEGYRGSAGTFTSPKQCKKVLLRAIKRIRKRIDETAPYDERLLLTTSLDLDRLEKNVRTTSFEVNNDWFIVGNLLSLISLLLGYDWDEGNVHRHVFFYQDRQQEVEDHIKIARQKFWDEFPEGDWRIRYEIVYALRKKNTSIEQIARVMDMSDKLVRRILKRIDEFEEKTGKAFFEEAKKLDGSFFSV